MNSRRSEQPSEEPRTREPARSAHATAQRLSRRSFVRRAVALTALPAAIGLYVTQVEPFWLQTHEIAVEIPGLPPQFDGFRIVHLSDMHAGHGVHMGYLARVVDGIDALRPDCVAVTGDLVDHTADTIEPVAELLGTIKAPVIVSFGNHDYAPGTARPHGYTILADPLQRALVARGCAVLRNSSVTLRRDTARIWFVGLEDLYTTRFSPRAAFARVDQNETILTLSHNPDSAVWLQNWNTRLILAGHTHGGQIRLPILGAPVLPLLNRRFDQGLFRLSNDCQMYVSRGVGYLWRARLFCRPELPCLVLRCAASSNA